MRALTARIAGRRYYTGTLTPLSNVTLERDSDNQQDRWAVRVVADGAPVGSLEAGLARLVAPILDRGRPVLASVVGQRQDALTLFVLDRRDRLAPMPRANLVRVPSASSDRSYVVDPVHGLCTCPAGRYSICRHKRLAIAQRAQHRIRAAHAASSGGAPGPTATS